uniref:Uncharacterized protein n=1 Tax=Oryza glumipatula TaxID=40148 RepID=A0A0E0ACG8_9ORYZ
MDLSPSSFPFVLSSRFSLLSSATQRRPPSPPIPLLDHPPTAPLSLLLSPSSPPPPSPPATDPIPPSSLEMDWPSPLGSSRHRRIELPRWSSSVPSRLGRSRPLGGGSGRRRGGRLSRYGAVDESGGGVVQAELFGRPDRRVQVVGQRWTSMDFPTRMLLWPPDLVTIDSPAVEVLELD